MATNTYKVTWKWDTQVAQGLKGSMAVKAKTKAEAIRLTKRRHADSRKRQQWRSIKAERI